MQNAPGFPTGTTVPPLRQRSKVLHPGGPQTSGVFSRSAPSLRSGIPDPQCQCGKKRTQRLSDQNKLPRPGRRPYTASSPPQVSGMLTSELEKETQAGHPLIVLSGTSRLTATSPAGCCPVPMGPLRALRQYKCAEISSQPAFSSRSANRADRRKAVAGKHGQLFVPFVAERSREDAHHHVRHVGTHRQQRRRSEPIPL